MKDIWVIANWKSNKTIAEALEWVSVVGPQIEKRDNLFVVVCPTFTAIPEVKKAIQVGGFPLRVGCQDLSPFDQGAYTGEEAASILKELVDLTILGHSERRQNFGETDEMVAEKANQAKNYDITPLVCVQDQQTPIPPDVHLIAYEPIFAIGTGNPDTPENADKVARYFKGQKGENLDVLYGGSVTASNVESFIGQPHINGVLIGKASLDAEEFVQIVNTSALLSIDTERSRSVKNSQAL